MVPTVSPSCRTAASIERCSTRSPNKTGGDRGHFYVNTTHTVNGVSVAEPLDGDSAPGEDLWMAGTSEYTDGCSDKYSALRGNLNNVRATR